MKFNIKKWIIPLAMAAGFVAGNADADTWVNRTKTFTGTALQWPWQLNADGTWTTRQPNFSDLAADTSSVIASPATHWTTYYGNTGTAKVGKLNRLMIGEAAKTSSDVISASPFQSTPSWASVFTAPTVPLSQLAVGSTIGATAITGYARVSDYLTWSGFYSQGTQGVIGAALEDVTSGGTIAVGVLPLGFKKANTPGITLAAQLDVNSEADCLAAAPYTSVVGSGSAGVMGQCWAVGLTSGAYAFATGKATGAMYIAAGHIGGPSFKVGIMSSADAFDTSLGSGGGGLFADLYRGQAIRWRNSGGTVDTEIFGDASGLRIMGALNVSGSTSGTIGIKPQAAAGTYNFNLPTTAGTANQPLLSQGGGASAMTWGAVSYPTSATSGGIPYFSSSSAMLSSAALAANAIVVGGGAGAAPKTTGCTIDATNTLTCSSSSQYMPQTVLNATYNGNTGPYQNFQKARGASIVQTGDNLGTLVFQGYDGSSYVNAALIQASVIGTPSAGNVVAGLGFLVGGATAVSVGSSTVSVLHGTASTSTSTGAFTVVGGVGIAGALYLGAGVNAASLPTTGGTIKGTLCVDTTGVIYVKTTAGACL